MWVMEIYGLVYIYATMYTLFIDKYIFNEWKQFIVFNEYANGNKFIRFKNKAGIFQLFKLCVGYSCEALIF